MQLGARHLMTLIVAVVIGIVGEGFIPSRIAAYVPDDLDFPVLEEKGKPETGPPGAPGRPSTPDGNQEVGHDGTYIAYANGIVRETKTGLEWVAGPDREVTWEKAKAWVEGLKVGGGGWRMPTVNELETLYQKGNGTRNITPLLKTTGWWVWSGELKGSSAAWAFFFYYGGRGWYSCSIIYDSRVFAVRSRRDR